MTQTLSDRALNRALLARQALLERDPLATATELIERFTGLQAQEPVVPYITLWNRLAGFVPDDLQTLTDSGAVLRVPLWRNTIHHVTRADFLRFWSLSRRGGNYKASGVTAALRAGLDPHTVAAAARELLPLTHPALGRALAERFPGHDPIALAHVAKLGLPIVHHPPASAWPYGGSAVCGLLEGADPGHADEALVLRYLAGFGPASVLDAQYFAGVTKLRPAFETLRPRLVTFRDKRGTELFDLPDAPRPPEDTPAPPRLLGVFDNALIGYADRSRILAPHYPPQIVGPHAPVLIDGFATATWQMKRRQPLVVTGAIPDDARAEAEALAASLGAPGVA